MRGFVSGRVHRRTQFLEQRMQECSAYGLDTQELFECIPHPDSATFANLVRFCERHRPFVLASLPFFAAEISHSGGFANMLMLIREAGGTKIYVSHNRLKFNTRFSLSLTEQEHDRLILSSDSSGLIDLPSPWGIFVAIRRAAIIVALKKKRPRGEIVRHFGVTDRYLRKLSSGLKPKSRNLTVSV